MRLFGRTFLIKEVVSAKFSGRHIPGMLDKGRR